MNIAYFKYFKHDGQVMAGFLKWPRSTRRGCNGWNFRVVNPYAKKLKLKKQFLVEKFGTIISFITDFSLSHQEDILKIFQ